MHGVPPLVSEAALDDDDRAEDDGDQQPRADGGRDRARIDAAAEHRRDLLRQRDLVEERVAPDAEDDVREHEVDARVAVPPVPDAQPVEADQPLEHRHAREQRHLQEREVGAQEAGDPRDARQHVARRRERPVAAVDPEPDDHPGVAEGDRRDERAGGEPARKAGRRRPGEGEDLLAHPGQLTSAV
jgi:hypothetical protein